MTEHAVKNVDSFKNHGAHTRTSCHTHANTHMHKLVLYPRAQTQLRISQTLRSWVILGNTTPLPPSPTHTQTQGGVLGGPFNRSDDLEVRGEQPPGATVLFQGDWGHSTYFTEMLIPTAAGGCCMRACARAHLCIERKEREIIRGKLRYFLLEADRESTLMSCCDFQINILTHTQSSRFKTDSLYSNMYNH